MKTLVLGSSGQIGTRLVKELRAQGHSVVGWDIERSKLEDLRDPHNMGRLEEVMTQVDMVFFLAFDVGGAVYLKEYQHTYEFVDNNSRIMVNTFELLRKTNKRFIFASSQMSNMTYSPYGALKMVGEKYTQALGGKVVKFWNVYDLETDPKKFHVITDFIVSARDEGVINCVTDGREVRQFLHGVDAARCMITMMMQWGRVTEDELHCAPFKWHTIQDIASIVAQHPDHGLTPGQVTYAKTRDDVQRDAKNEPDRAVLKYWQPTISLRDGIHMVIKEMKEVGV